MTREAEHPSFLELDRFALGATRFAETQDHVADCATCREYVEKLQRPLPVPAWAQVSRPPRRSRRWMIFGLSGAGAALAACLLLVTLIPEEEEYTTMKGTPSVGVYVKRADRIALWSGEEPFSPGDAVRLRVVPEGYSHVSVFAEVEGSLRPLYRGTLELPEQGMLPVAWKMDEKPGDEVLVIVLAGHLVGAGEALAHMKDPQPGLWLKRLVLPKKTGDSP